ncbi:sensor histidine kinase [Carboxylicivirga marina]|uniref:Histidine kinase n=1 Tax=Carboxylicivirga marina TaxID=2800988 RepID=A0ABS1HJY4_9BACT|nr:histidine kinase [Carboxylicivirga marina]MBK3517989.1 histidine kinase [Carboxylicivirga marina]
MTANTQLYSSKKLVTQILVSTLYGVLAFVYLYYSENGGLPVLIENIDSISFFTLSSWLIFGILTLTARGINMIYPWIKGMPSRFMIQFVLNTIVATVFLWLSIKLLIAIKYDNISFNLFMEEKGDVTIKFFIIFLLTNLIFILVDLYQYSFTSFIQANIESEKMVRERLKLQYEILKSQLSPHYLFNTLNTIASLIHRDASTTEGFIRKFAQTFSYILNSHQKELVPLSQEVDFINAYYYLLRIRFEKALELDIQLDKNGIKSYIPPMTLQLLVENAVKHNQFSEDKPLKICIRSNGDGRIEVRNNFERKPGFIEVDNQLVKKPEPHVSHKIGLENIKKRYAYFTKHEVEISKNENFVVLLPLLLKHKIIRY